MNELLTAIRAELDQFWRDQDPLGAGDGQRVDDLIAAMDSFTACAALERLESLLGVELPSADLVRRGGYDNKAHFLDDLSQAVADYVAQEAP